MQMATWEARFGYIWINQLLCLCGTQSESVQSEEKTDKSNGHFQFSRKPLMDPAESTATSATNWQFKQNWANSSSLSGWFKWRHRNNNNNNKTTTRPAMRQVSLSCVACHRKSPDRELMIQLSASESPAQTRRLIANIRNSSNRWKQLYWTPNSISESRASYNFADGLQVASEQLALISTSLVFARQEKLATCQSVCLFVCLSVLRNGKFSLFGLFFIKLDSESNI